MTVRLTLWFLLSLVLGLPASHAMAQDLVTERAMFKDTRGDMTFEQVQRAPFAKTDPVIGLGYTRAALWVRLTVDSPPNTGTLVLRVAPEVLDEVTLFESDGASTGLRHRSFLIDAKSGKSRYYLRIKTTGTLLVSPAVLTEEQAQRADITRAIMLGAVLACCLPLMVALLVLIAVRREPLHWSFLLNFGVSVAIFFAWLGYFVEFFGRDSWVASGVTLNFLAVTNIFTGFLFLRVMFGRFGLPRWGQYCFNLFFLLYAPLFVLFFVLDRQSILVWSSVLGIVACAFCLPLAAHIFFRQKPASRFIGSVVLLALVLMFRSSFTLQGIVAPDASTMSLLAYRIFFLTGFFTSIFILMDRDQKSRLQVSILNEAVARQLAAFEKHRRETQERFMTMLMHELKTPLAIIQLAATSLGRHLLPDSGDAKRVRNINRSVDDLNSLIERCAQADQIEQDAVHIHKQTFALTTLTNDLLQMVGADRIRLVCVQPMQTVFSDYQYLRLILQNLLSNALKYSPAGSMVELQIESTSLEGVASVQFRVVNAVGPCGAPDPAQVFSRYYRSEAARQHVGAGLGLWLAQAVARQLGLKIDFQTIQGQVAFGFGLAQA
jgi:signal transduction histidine kinase